MPVHGFKGILCSVAIGFLCVSNTGCHHAFGSKCVRVSQWQLDPERRIALLFIESSYPDWAGEELTYSLAKLEIRNARLLSCGLEDEAILYYTIGSPKRRVPPSKERFEIRADESRKRIWVVNLVSGRIVGTYNIETGETSGSSEARPVWAQADGGVALKGIPTN